MLFSYFRIIWMPVLMMVSVALPAWAEGDRPAFNSSRYEEDYRFLRDPEQRTDFFDPLKYIPLNESESVYLTLGGETRQHFEFIDIYFNPFYTFPQFMD